MNKKFLVEIALLMGMLFTVFAEGVCSYAESYNKITEDVFRLHVLANSDSEDDQKLKLKVRDAILESSEDIFAESNSAYEAADLTEENLELFKTVAEKTIRDNGYNYSVVCELENTYLYVPYRICG